MYVSLTPKSNNRTGGESPVSTTEERSCPSECPLRGTDCYARFGPLGMHWRKVGKSRGDNWTRFCDRVRRFPAGQAWRHNQAGDLPQRTDGRINRRKSLQLSRAARHTNGWTYTHYDPADEHNRQVVKDMNAVGGLTVNLSADDLSQADEYVDLGIGPVTVVLPQDAPLRGNVTPNGNPIVICPAQISDDVTCAKCPLCRSSGRKSIVGFRAHGTASKRLSAKLSAD